MTPRKPRKMPKNQRAYPKKGKTHFVDVQQPEAGKIVASNFQIDTPHIAYTTTDAETGAVVSVRLNASEWRKWRALRNPT